MRKRRIYFTIINTIEKLDNPLLDFSLVKKIDVGSALYIKAYYDYLIASKKSFKIYCSEKNQKMRQILKHIRVNDYDLLITHPDIKCWFIKQWNFEHKENYGKVIMNEILPKVLENKVPSEEFSKIAGSLHELLANCSEHAYPNEHTFQNYYLIAGEYANEYSKSNKFSFCILDLGQGFRKSISNYSKFQDALDSIIRKESDSMLLKKTTEGVFNANKDKNSGRGTGLQEVAKNVKNIRGSLYIYSDKGSFKIKNGDKEYFKDRKSELKGSIIEIILPISDNRGREE